MSLTISSKSFCAFSLPYVLINALRTALSKFFIFINITPFYIKEVVVQKGILNNA